MEFVRSFIAIELPAEIKQALLRLQSKLKKGEHAVKWVDPDSIHLTLKFLGETATEKIDLITAAIEIAAGGITPFHLAVSELGVFPSPRQVRVVWVGLSGDLEPLLRLQKNIESEVSPLGFPTEARSFTPHLTLGRVRDYASPEERQNLGKLVVDTRLDDIFEFPVASVNLMRSQLSREGAVYSRLSTIVLK